MLINFRLVVASGSFFFGPPYDNGGNLLLRVFYSLSLHPLYMMISTLDDESYSGLPMTKQNFNTIHAISDSSYYVPALFYATKLIMLAVR